MSNGNQGRLTTHVLDTSAGVPAANLSIDLYRIDGQMRDHVKTVVTNSDGRCDAPLLEGENFTSGEYELIFHLGDYFAGSNGGVFLNLVPVRFIVSNADQHYHVPLLASPFGYSTYRGS
ncbi:MAG: hydroxyisourate hydrolase [Hyphomicrobiales bacterium]